MPPTPGAPDSKVEQIYRHVCIQIDRQPDRQRDMSIVVYILTTFRIELKQCASSSNKNRLAQIFADQID